MLVNLTRVVAFERAPRFDKVTMVTQRRPYANPL